MGVGSQLVSIRFDKEVRDQSYSTLDPTSERHIA